MGSQPSNPPEPAKPPASPATKPAATPAADAGHVPITEEMDSAKWTLPPVVPILIGLGVIAVVIAVVAVSFRAKPMSGGSITGVYSVDVPDQNTVMVELLLTAQNVGEKPMYVRGTRIEVEVPGQAEPLKDDGNANPQDFDRYFQAFPELKQHAIAPFSPETRIPVGQQQSGMVVVSFPVPKATFDQRKSLKAVVLIDDQNPLVLEERK